MKVEIEAGIEIGWVQPFFMTLFLSNSLSITYLIQTVLLSSHNIDRVFFTILLFMIYIEMIVMTYESDNLMKPWIELKNWI